MMLSKKGENIKSKFDEEYMEKIKNIKFKPVFILGLHRSGTTILYKMLGETKLFNIFTMYHLLNYDELIYNHINNLEEKKKKEFNNFLIKKGITNRKTDNIMVSSNYEHEYVYFFSQRNLPVTLSEKNKEVFENMCKKIQFISENDKPILLKNPYDFPNFLKIKKFFPEAKFVFIHRNPLEVISSIMRLWQTRLKNKDEFAVLYSKQYENAYTNKLSLFLMRLYYVSPFPLGIFEVIWRSRKTTKYYLKNIKYLTKDDFISIKYEDLCMEPNKVIGKILNFLNLKSDIDFIGYVKPRKLDLTREIIFMKKFIFKLLRPYFEFFSYKI